MTDQRTRPIVLGPGEGRTYAMGAMRAVFKADEDETGAAYSISEWWLEPHSEGPGPHSHEANDDIFYVIEGVMSFRLGEDWIDAEAGSFVRAAPGVTHDFANRTGKRAGVLNLYVPGGFERDMPAIVKWFADNEK
ncbi:cupin domain-containing protein [Brevundimonas sp. S30B]|uniref:cupin domain-containing protein n=1 Tax=unclassified Brevundimonas TaxID=2622653 RepID=UPI001072038B|nr:MULTISPECIES: cupin domain-containing protein [unclassified Brevundimonas]QBX38514.1 cupin domain-containing protein [Brevundimonas sp. MF30-B]TFW02222.1 cupin domain-containing protein [Brevundimonas sp. S30B]